MDELNIFNLLKAQKFNKIYNLIKKKKIFKSRY